MQRHARPGFSLLEMLAAITIIGIIAVIVIPRLSTQGWTAKAKVCDQYVGDINAAIERYYFDNGVYPTTLTDLQGNYYPDVIPVCPATGAAYSMNPASHAVAPHNH